MDSPSDDLRDDRSVGGENVNPVGAGRVMAASWRLASEGNRHPWRRQTSRQARLVATGNLCPRTD